MDRCDFSLFKRYAWLLVAFVAALSGCHEDAVNPLSSSTESKHDERLSGAWIAKGKDGAEIESLHLHFGKVQFTSFVSLPLPLMDVVLGSVPTAGILIAHSRTGAMELTVLEIFPTEIANHNYMSVNVVDERLQGHSGYFFVRYALDEKNQKLALWKVDLKKAVESGKLHGTIQGEKVTVIDSTSELRDFITSAAPQELFLPEPDFVFEKIARN